jgi:hypothetical protein
MSSSVSQKVEVGVAEHLAFEGLDAADVALAVTSRERRGWQPAQITA